jgi:hypothetical protein
MNPLRVRWFTSGMGTIGIVMAEDDHGSLGYYIGVGMGLHPGIDINNIAALGARFPEEVGELLFGVKKPKAKNAPAKRTRTPKLA